MLSLLQIINNIAIIVTDEADPGTRSYTDWVTVLHVADVVACAVVLFPIMWSIRHIKQAQEADRDEKTKDTLIRLTQFRSFYLTTMAWLYFTRIVVYVMLQTLAFDRQWLSQFFDEVATIAYYAWVGYRFRPAADNSDYLRVPQDDDGPESSGGGGDLEMVVAPSATVISLDDKPDAKATATSTRVHAPSQSLAKGAHTASDDNETSAGSSATATHVNDTQGASAKKQAGKKPIAIADDDHDDEFGVDDDDFDFQTKRGAAGGGGGANSQSAGGAGSSAGGLRSLKARLDEDDDL